MTCFDEEESDEFCLNSGRKELDLAFELENLNKIFAKNVIAMLGKFWLSQKFTKLTSWCWLQLIYCKNYSGIFVNISLSLLFVKAGHHGSIKGNIGSYIRCSLTTEVFAWWTYVMASFYLMLRKIFSNICTPKTRNYVEGSGFKLFCVGVPNCSLHAFNVDYYQWID